jgi:hypothetical protein
MDDKELGQIDPANETFAITTGTAQKLIDENVDARQRLDYSNKRLDAFVAQAEQVDAAIHKAVSDYKNPSAPNPPPIDPATAAPPPMVEPPVFTSVDSATLDGASTSGGESVVAPELTLPTEGGEQPTE